MVLRKKALDQQPFGILEVGRVFLVEFGHSPILPDYLRNALLAIRARNVRKPAGFQIWSGTRGIWQPSTRMAPGLHNLQAAR